LHTYFNVLFRILTYHYLTTKYYSCRNCPTVSQFPNYTFSVCASHRESSGCYCTSASFWYSSDQWASERVILTFQLSSITLNAFDNLFRFPLLYNQVLLPRSHWLSSFSIKCLFWIKLLRWCRVHFLQLTQFFNIFWFDMLGKVWEKWE
jgi:hypothetical protein